MEEKNLETLKAKTLSLPEKVKTIIIKGPEGIERANKALIYIKTIRKEIENFFADTLAAAKESKKKADEAKKAVENLKFSIEEPLIIAENYVKKLVADYRIEEERLKKEAESKATFGEETAQSRAVIEAPAAKTKGMYDVWLPDREKIANIVKQTNGQIKIPGVEIYCEWNYRVVDADLIPKEYKVLSVRQRI